MTVLLFLTPKIHTSYFLAGPTDSSNLHTSATKSSCPQIPPPPRHTPYFSQVPNSQNPNSFAPRKLQRGRCQGLGPTPCFQGTWNAKINCSFLLVLWQKWPSGVASPETDGHGSLCTGCHGEERLKGAFSKPIGAWPIRCPRATNKY